MRPKKDAPDSVSRSVVREGAHAADRMLPSLAVLDERLRAGPPTARSGDHRDFRGRGGANLKTALILVSIALVFFVGVVVRHWLW